MEEKVRKIYQKMKGFQLKSITVALGSMVILTIIISLFEGNPMPTMESDGWILEKMYLWIGVAVVAILYNWMWQMRTMQKMYQPFIELLNEKCDPLALKDITRYGMDYGMNLKGRGARSAFYYFEYNYILALNGTGAFEEAILYLEALWHSKHKMKSRDHLLLMVQLNNAADKNQKQEYFKLWEQIPPRMKKNPIWLAQLARMEDKPEAAIEILENCTVKRPLEKVGVHAGMGEAYVALGEYEKAKGHLLYVKEHGNTTFCRKRALEHLKKIEEQEV